MSARREGLRVCVDLHAAAAISCRGQGAPADLRRPPLVTIETASTYRKDPPALWQFAAIAPGLLAPASVEGVLLYSRLLHSSLASLLPS